MSGKHRTLPSWMAKKEDKAKEKKAPLKTQKKPRAARAVFYCMNEAELVEAAASCLTDGSCEDVLLLFHQQAKNQAQKTAKPKPDASRIKEKRFTEILEESSSDCSADPETTSVSETGLDITEAEKLPYMSPQHPESEGEKDDHKLINTDVETEKEKQMAEDAVEEDEALRLVREIFFT
ncbi:cell cycle regulator of non-homologous end joining [Nothobranchius furzeri]|uniref:Modulator of retrovirus infection-like protein n=1 Tax=Nothobranchius furzeri TaxID=105023 RepID=A0A1A8V740_NOTFU|nr:modulator of retrovirus infection-like protein [Nothobranchius furzeri]